MAGAYDNLVGELWPGAYGWLPLDSAGTPSGPATIDPPAPGPDVYACFVYSPVPDPDPTHDPLDLLTTPTGAPITDNMNSNVDKRDTFAGMYKSAPKPADWEDTQPTESKPRR